MKGRMVAAAACVVAGVAGCSSAGQAGTGGIGRYSLIGATYPACESQGQSLATYLATGNPAADNLNWGNYRQDELSLSGAQQSLYISQVADEYISQCDSNTAASASASAAAAAASASAQAAASQQAAASASASALWAAIQANAGTECAKIGGGLTSLGPACTNVPYYGTDGSTYYDSLGIQGTALAPDASGGAGTTDTKSDCEQGYYPNASAGPAHGTPGYFAYGICLVSNPN